MVFFDYSYPSTAVSPPKISVLMSVYNGGVNLRKAIESILNQTFKDFEFIIVDDCSTDSTPEILNYYLQNDARIKVIKNDQNIGLAGSLDKAIKSAQGEFIARMDADDIAADNRFEIQLSFLEKNPEISLVGSSMYMIDFEDRVIALSSAVTNPEILKKIIYYKNVCPHPTWMFRKKVLKDIKGYRNLPASQDYDFLMRLFNLGYGISNIDIPLLYYRVHKKKISFDGSIVQIKLSRYLRKLYKNSLILNDEYFKKDQISKIITTVKTVQQIHSLSLRLFERGRFMMKNNSSNPPLPPFSKGGVGGFLGGSILLCISALLSPYMAYFIYCGMRAKLLERKT